MLKVKIGLSRRKRVPVLYILDGTYLLHKALILLWNSRWVNEKDKHKEYTTLETRTNALKLTYQHATYMVREWREWEKYYLPSFSLGGKTVLDVGAGCGETALLFFWFGAKKVIAIEPDSKAVEYLRENTAINKWNVEIIPERFSLKHLKLDFDFVKIDVEGDEEMLLSLQKLDKPCVVEVHGDKLLKRFTEKDWVKIHTMGNENYLMTNKKVRTHYYWRF